MHDSETLRGLDHPFEIRFPAAAKKLKEKGGTDDTVRLASVSNCNVAMEPAQDAAGPIRKLRRPVGIGLCVKRRSEPCRALLRSVHGWLSLKENDLVRLVCWQMVHFNLF